MFTTRSVLPENYLVKGSLDPGSALQRRSSELTSFQSTMHFLLLVVALLAVVNAVATNQGSVSSPLATCSDEEKLKGAV